MSRAFVTESDGSELDAERARRTHSDQPNYITADGFAGLEREYAQLQARRAVVHANPQGLGAKEDLKRLDEDLAYVAERMRRAITVQTPKPPWRSVGMGARVELIDETGLTQCFSVVGEDEIDVPAGRISWCSPLGKALLGAKLGDEVSWVRPAGNIQVEILAIDYPVSAR